MPVAIQRRGVRWPVRPLRSDAATCLRLLGKSKAELSLVLCDDAFMRELNRTWRQKDAPTDVLAFPMDATVLGDVVISVETAVRQAEALGHDAATEIRVLLVHGLLHLLGHDHHADAEDAAMAAEEERLLTALGVPHAGLVARARL